MEEDKGNKTEADRLEAPTWAPFPRHARRRVEREDACGMLVLMPFMLLLTLDRSGSCSSLTHARLPTFLHLLHSQLESSKQFS